MYILAWILLLTFLFFDLSVCCWIAAELLGIGDDPPLLLALLSVAMGFPVWALVCGTVFVLARGPAWLRLLWFPAMLVNIAGALMACTGLSVSAGTWLPYWPPGSIARESFSGLIGSLTAAALTAGSPVIASVLARWGERRAPR